MASERVAALLEEATQILRSSGSSSSEQQSQQSNLSATLSRASAMLQQSSSSGVYNRLNRNERLRAAGGPYNNNRSRSSNPNCNNGRLTTNANARNRCKNDKPIEFALLSANDDEDENQINNLKWDSVVANGIIMVNENDGEEVIRTKIKDSLKGTFPMIGKNDYNFVKVSRKQISMMNLAPGMEYSFTVVKKLAGQGLLYVQMKEAFQCMLEKDSVTDEDFEKEVFPPSETSQPIMIVDGIDEDEKIQTPLMNDCEEFNIEKIVKQAKKEQFMSPVELLRFLQKEILTGRVLDLTSIEEVSTGETNHISVDRDSILNTTFIEFKYVTNFRKTFEVDFMGEESVDLGGPRKEWIKLMNKAINAKYFEHGFRLLLADEYFHVGAMLGIAVLQNGQMPSFIAEDILQQIFANDKSNPCIMQLCKGLELTGLATCMKEFPSLVHFFRPGAQQQCNVLKLKTLLKPNFSERGSNALMKEKAVYTLFCKYAREVYAGRRETSSTKLELGTILEFVTGACEEPVLGFMIEPSINFVEPIHSSFYPTAQTCSNVLMLPRPTLEDPLPKEERLFEIYDMSFAQKFFGKK